jgi:hypothetical protein
LSILFQMKMKSTKTGRKMEDGKKREDEKIGR